MQFVFTVTAGRTGTRSLADSLASRLPGARVHHELSGPELGLRHVPSLELRLAFNNMGNTATVQEFWKHKFAAVLAEPCHTWVETSHLLCKGGLVENLRHLPAGNPVTLVALRRERTSLVRSLRRLGDFGRVGNRRLWYLDEKSRRNLLPLPDELAPSALGLAFWYALEMECRQAWLRREVATGAAGESVEWLDMPTAGASGGPAVDALVRRLRAGAGLGEEPTSWNALPLNTNPAPPLEPDEEEGLAALSEAYADFDAERWLEERRPRPTHFAASRGLPRLARPQPGTRPGVFIGGPGRSGTTALVDLLGCHPSLSPVYETEPLPRLLSAAGRKPSPGAMADTVQSVLQSWAAPLPLRPHSKAPHERYLHGPHHVRMERRVVESTAAALARRIRAGDSSWQVLHDGFGRLFQAAAAADGKTRWVNKTPLNLAVLPLLLSVFPRSRFLVCVRDPRDVALSVVQRPWGPDRIEDVPTWWRSALAPWLALRESCHGRVRVVRYEDLVCSPEATLNGVLAFVGEPAGAGAMLARWRGAGLALDSARIGRWREVLSPAQAEAFRNEAGNELDLFGYRAG